MSDSNGKRITVVLRNDDPSALSDVEHERRIAAIFQRHRVPQTLAVVPFHTLGDTHHKAQTGRRSLAENRAMVAFLQEYLAESGSEVALHGYSHQTNRFSLPDRREYFEFRAIDVDEQRELIADGKRHLEETLGVEIESFIPPWNRLDDNTLAALEAEGFRITSAALYERATPRLVHFGTNCFPATFPEIYRLIKAADRRIFLNLYYHSCTTRSDAELAALEHAVKTVAEDPECEVLTLREAVARYEPELRRVNEAARAVAPLSMARGSVASRASLYHALLRRLLPRDRVTALKREAHDAYYAGDYARCIALAGEIDRASRLLQWSARAMLAAIACVGVALVFAAVGDNAVRLAPLILAMTIGIGGALRWRATSADSRREMVAATLSLLLGAGLGIGVG